MKISCDEATTICDKSQYREASFMERIKLSLHLFICKTCGLYSKQNNVMSKCYGKLKKHKNCTCLSDDEKQKMEHEIEKKSH